jgi:hypothetical protein
MTVGLTRRRIAITIRQHVRQLCAAHHGLIADLLPAFPR